MVLDVSWGSWWETSHALTWDELDKYGVYPMNKFQEFEDRYREINNAMCLVKDNWSRSGEGDDNLQDTDDDDASITREKTDQKWLGADRLRFLSGRNPAIMYFWYAMWKCGNLVYCDTQLNITAAGDTNTVDDGSFSSKGSSKASKGFNLDKQYIDLAIKSNENLDRMMIIVQTAEEEKLKHMQKKEFNKMKININTQIDTWKSKKMEVVLSNADQETKSKVLADIDSLILKKEKELADLLASEQTEASNQTKTVLENTPKMKNSSGKRLKSSS
jgi:hypothetical protein